MKNSNGYWHITFNRNKKIHNFNLNPYLDYLVDEPREPLPLNFARNKPTEIQIFGDFKKNEWVVFKEEYFPRWKSYMDGKEIPLLATNNRMMLIKTNEGDKIIQENGKTKVEYLFEMYPLSDIHRVVKSIAEDYSFISNHPSSFFNGNHPNIEERTQDRNTSSVERAKRIEKFYSENRESINELTLHNTRLLAIIANSFHDVHMEFMDRFQYGFFGLQRAAEGFDHRKGYKFSTYASKIIRRSIFDALEDNSQMIGIPIEKELLIIKMNYTRGLLKSSLQREPTRDEITKSMGLNNQELKELEDL